MKRRIILSIVMAVLTVNSFAQMDRREPGLYAIVGEESIPLTFANGINVVNSTEVMGVDVGKMKCSYKGPSSGTIASGTFVLVIDPEKKAIVRNMKSYNPFVKKMTPDNIRIIPLAVVKNKRVYDEGKTISGINVSVRERTAFEWEQLSDNSFEIRVQGLAPGEYGFVFRAAKMADFDYSAIFGFTIPE